MDVTTQQVILGVSTLAAFGIGGLLTHLAHTKAGEKAIAWTEAEAKRLQAAYDAHTTPAERTAIDALAREGLNALGPRVGTLETQVASLAQQVQTAANAAKAATPGATPAPAATTPAQGA